MRDIALQDLTPRTLSEQISQRVQKSIDKLLERAGKGKLKTRIVVL